MKTIIKIALRNRGGDPEWRELNCSGVVDEMKNPPKDPNNFNRFGLMYILSNKGDSKEQHGEVSFVYMSDEKINGYQSYIIKTEVDLLPDYPSEKLQYAVDYLWSKPKGITNKIGEEELKEVLSASSISEIFSRENHEVKFNDESRRLVSVIVDKLLCVLKNVTTAKIGIIGKADTELIKCQELLYLVLRMALPASIANKVSFNSNANGYVSGIDIFCSTYSVGMYEQSCTLVDINNMSYIGEQRVSDYRYKNAYAEYISNATDENIKKIVAGAQGKQSVEELNKTSAIPLLKVKLNKDSGYNSKELLEFMTYYGNALKIDREGILADTEIQIMFTKLAYMLFFSGSFYNVDDNCRNFYKEFIKSANSKNIVYNKIYSGRKRFSTQTITDNFRHMLLNRDSEQIAYYVVFLIDNFSSFYSAIQKKIKQELNDDENIMCIVKCLRERYGDISAKEALLNTVNDNELKDLLLKNGFVKASDFVEMDRLNSFYEKFIKTKEKKKVFLETFDEFYQKSSISQDEKEKKKIIQFAEQEIASDKVEAVSTFFYNDKKRNNEDTVNDYRSNYYKGLDKICRSNDWIKVYEKSKMVIYPNRGRNAYVKPWVVSFFDGVVALIIIGLVFSITHFAIYPLIINRYLPTHDISIYRVWIELACLIVATIVMLIKLCRKYVEIKNMGSDSTSLSGFFVRDLLEGLVLGIAIIAALAIVLFVWFMV